VGAIVGDTVGSAVGVAVGVAVGAAVGVAVGDAVGASIAAVTSSSVAVGGGDALGCSAGGGDIKGSIVGRTYVFVDAALESESFSCFRDLTTAAAIRPATSSTAATAKIRTRGDCFHQDVDFSVAG